MSICTCAQTCVHTLLKWVTNLYRNKKGVPLMPVGIKLFNFQA